jgi:hypothetical protein
MQKLYVLVRGLRTARRVSEGDARAAAVPSDKARRLRVASNKPDGDVVRRVLCVRA